MTITHDGCDNATTFCIRIPSDGPDKSAQERVLKSIRGDNNDDNGSSGGGISSNDDDDVSKNYNNITCQIQITNECCDSSSSSTTTTNTDAGRYWVLQSFDVNGQPKRIGGDEYYITYEEIQTKTITTTKTGTKPSKTSDDEEKDGNCSTTTATTLLSAVAYITDNENGTYKLDFCTTPMNPNIQTPKPLSSGEEVTTSKEDDSETTSSSSSTTITKFERILTVYFEYSNFIGYMYPPSKNQWNDGGYTHTKYVMSSRSDDVLLQRPPNIRIFQPPRLHSSSLKLNNYDKVLVFGDSSYCQLTRQRPNKKGKYYFQPNIKFGEKIRIPLNTQTVSEFLVLLDEQHGNELQQNVVDVDADDDKGKVDLSNNKIALILGSSLWDLLDSYDTIQSSTSNKYENHIQAMRTLLCEVHKLYPHVTLYWKLPTAIHIHVVDLQRLIIPPTPVAKPTSKTTTATLTTTTTTPSQSPTLFGIDRVRYMSSSRSKFLYQLQKKLLDEEFSTATTNTADAGGNDNIIPFVVHYLDLYDATYSSANQLYPSDGRHYRPDLNRLMLSWYYD